MSIFLFFSSCINFSGDCQSFPEMTIDSTPRFSALFRTRASGLLLTTNFTLPVGLFLKYRIRFSAFVPEPEAKTAIFIFMYPLLVELLQITLSVLQFTLLSQRKELWIINIQLLW